VASDDLCAFSLDAEIFAYALRHIAVACAVESVATDAILSVQIVWESIHVCIVRHSLMECSVEHTNLRNLRKEFLNGIDTLDVCRIMKRRKVVASSKSLHHLVCKEYALVELLATVNSAMTHSVKFVKTAKHSIFTFCEYLKDELHTLSVLWDWFVDLHLLAVSKLDFDERIRKTDFLNTSRCEYALIVHVIERIFD
jgi:hypothetical protein